VAGPLALTVRAVVFDVGETLVDETRLWSAWADALGVPRLTFLAVLGGVIARGGDHLEPFGLLRPEVDVEAVLRDPAMAHLAEVVRPEDLYPDAVPCLEALVALGYRVGIAGNQPSDTEVILRGLGVPLAFVASSATFGAAKPDPAFFKRIGGQLGLPMGEIAYVGDRMDNDIRPAKSVGMVAAFVRRGPWAWLQAGRADPPEADIVVDSLAELPDALARTSRKR
jgi:HAD superfamily hydrolase (TIGR01549 family)